jgi:hypothetical protein
MSTESENYNSKHIVVKGRANATLTSVTDVGVGG